MKNLKNLLCLFVGLVISNSAFAKTEQVKHLVPKEPFIMDGKTYDAYTGATNMIRKATQEEIDELFG